MSLNDVQSGSGQFFLLKPRLTGILYSWDGVAKPYLLALSSVNFSSPVGVAVGGGAGVQFDLNRHIGMLIEVPVEYFFNTPSNRDPFVLLFTAGIQGRL